MQNYLKRKLLVGLSEFLNKLEWLGALFTYADGRRLLGGSLSFESELGLLDFFYYILLGESLLQLEDEACETVAAEAFFVELVLGVGEVVIVVLFADKAVISFPRVSRYPLNIKMEVRLFSSSFSLIPL